MEKLLRNKIKRIKIYLLIPLLVLLVPLLSSAKPPLLSDGALEGEILQALQLMNKCKKIEVRVIPGKEKGGKLKVVMVKFDGIPLGQIVADHMTLIYEDAVIDLPRLRQSKELNIASYSKSTVGILISAPSIEQYLDRKAKEAQKRYHRISVKFSPPHIECLFDAPAREISRETLALFDKFIKLERIEGYAALRLEAKNNQLYASTSKVIINHILIPDFIPRQLEAKFNPFDAIPVLKPFRYTINAVTVQNRFLFLSN